MADEASEECSQRVREVIAGIPAAAAWLYDTFAPGLCHRLQRRYGYPGGLEVEDLLHDTFVMVLKDNGRRLAAYLERTATDHVNTNTLRRFLWDESCGLASNRLRVASRQRVVEMADFEPRDGTRATEDGVIDRDLLSKITRCLRNRGHRIFLYFMFRYVDGLKPDEICRATGWSRKSTYKMRQRFNEALKECAAAVGLAFR